jgi:flagellar motility protein MotE (MotC chaperone)
MSDETPTPEEEHDEVITDVKGKLQDDAGNLSRKDLEELRKELKEELSAIRRDKATEQEEKDRQEGKIDKLQEHIEKLLEAQEARDKKTSDSSTIVVPPSDLDPPTHQNIPDVQPENEQVPETKRKMRWW